MKNAKWIVAAAAALAAGLLTLPRFLTGGSSAVTPGADGTPTAKAVQGRRAGQPEPHPEGHERRRLQAVAAQGKGAAGELLGVVVRPVPRRDPGVHQGPGGVPRQRLRDPRHLHRRQRRAAARLRREEQDELSARAGDCRGRGRVRPGVRAADVDPRRPRRLGVQAPLRPALPASNSSASSSRSCSRITSEC